MTTAKLAGDQRHQLDDDDDDARASSGSHTRKHSPRAVLASARRVSYCFGGSLVRACSAGKAITLGTIIVLGANDSCNVRQAAPEHLAASSPRRSP